MKNELKETLIGSKVAHYRALAGITQEELAKKAGISKTYVSHIETGLKRPTFKMTVKLAKALKIDWKELAVSPIMKKIEEMKISDGDKEKLRSAVGTITSYI